MLPSSAVIGLMTGLSLAVAIGAQNAFILRQGLKREHVFKIVLFCSCADAFLMSCGVYGLETAAKYVPLLVPFMKWGGCAFIFIYGLLSFRRALNTEALVPESGAAQASSWRVIWPQLAVFTFLNPHVYADTLLLVGSLAQSQPPGDRLPFLLGTVGGSVVWFFSLAYGARLLVPYFKNPMAWRVLDIVIGITMWAIAASILVM